MIVQKIEIQEFYKNFNFFKENEIIEIIDKKTDNLKGIFLPQKEAEEFKQYLKEKEKKEKRIKKLMQYAGSIEVDEKFKNLSKQELKTKIANLKSGNINE